MLRVGKSKLKALAAAATVAAPAVSMAQVSSTWINPGSQTWSTVTNWQGGLLPDSGGTAVLPATSISDALANIHLNTNRTLGRLDYQGNFTGSKAYAITGGSNLQMNPGATINVDSGTHRIANGNFLSSGELIKTGNGTVILNGNASFTAAGGITPLLSINGGVVEARGANSLRGISGIATANGSALELNNVGNVGSIVLGLGGATAPNGAVRVIGGTNNVTSGFLIVVDTGTINVGTGFAYSFNGMMFDSNEGLINGLNKVGAGTFNYQAVGLGMSMQGPLNVTAGAMNMIGPGVATNLNVTGGTFSYAAGSLTAVNPVNVNGGAFNLNAGGSLSGNTTLTAGTFNHNGGVQLGTVTVNGGTALLNGGTIATLAINGGTVRAPQRATANAASGVTRLSSLAIAGGQSLDLTNNTMVIDYTGASIEGAIRALLLAGRGGAGFGNETWAGPGIRSSTLNDLVVNQGEFGFALGYANNGDLPFGPYGTFGGQTVDNDTILIKYTRSADATLDGIVNDDDVTIIGAFYGDTSGLWSLGDVDYSGSTDDGDVTLLGAFYDPSAPALSPEFLEAQYGAEFAAAFAAGQAMAAALVPEPGSLGLLAFGGALLAGRRRRRS